MVRWTLERPNRHHYGGRLSGAQARARATCSRFEWHSEKWNWLHFAPRFLWDVVSFVVALARCDKLKGERSLWRGNITYISVQSDDDCFISFSPANRGNIRKAPSRLSPFKKEKFSRVSSFALCLDVILSSFCKVANVLFGCNQQIGAVCAWARSWDIIQLQAKSFPLPVWKKKRTIKRISFWRGCFSDHSD